MNEKEIKGEKWVDSSPFRRCGIREWCVIGLLSGWFRFPYAPEQLWANGTFPATFPIALFKMRFSWENAHSYNSLFHLNVIDSSHTHCFTSHDLSSKRIYLAKQPFWDIVQIVIWVERVISLQNTFGVRLSGTARQVKALTVTIMGQSRDSNMVKTYTWESR